MVTSMLGGLEKVVARAKGPDAEEEKRASPPPTPVPPMKWSDFSARLSSALSASSAAGTLSEDLLSSRRSRTEHFELILAHWPLWARADQLPPATTRAGEPWRVWLILGGRGAGKTRAGRRMGAR